MRRAGWGAVFAILIVATASCTSSSKPTEERDIPDARPLANEVAGILLDFSAYDYALIGSLNGERQLSVPPERYAAVARTHAERIAESATKIVAASVHASGPVRDAVVKVADSMGQLRKDALVYADTRSADALARVIGDVDGGWSLLRDLATMLKDPALDKTIARGSAMKATATPSSGALLTMGPYADAAEAAEKAKLLGGIGVPSTTSPFIVRASFKDRASAEAAAAEVMKKSVIAIVIDQTSYAFARSGTAPDAELWREPERFIETHGGARRLAVSTNAHLVATGSDDGYIAVFSADGALRSLPRSNAGVNQLVFTDDASFLIAGGQVLVTFPMPSPATWLGVGTPMRLRNASQSVVYVPNLNYFVASSAGDDGAGGVIGGRAPDGVVLDSPFPIETASGGALLGASDAGELFIATPVGNNVEVWVLVLGRDPAPRGVLQVPGAMRGFALDRTGTYGAVVTDQGTFRFVVKTSDPSSTIRKIAPVAREVEFAPDGTLYVLEPQKLTAFTTDGVARWSQPLIDGRRLAVAARPVVLDGTSRLLAFAPQDGTQDLLAPVGQIQDLVASRGGSWIGVIADARRAVLFRLR